MKRRDFLRNTAAGVAAGLTGISRAHGVPEEKEALGLWRRLPQWHGFNLCEKFMVHSNARFIETDFAWIAELGFNFARLPMDYRCWTEPDDWTTLKEDVLKEIDEAVAFGRKHTIHVCINFHRAPGYTVAKPEEEHNLWRDPEAQRVCALHWAAFAKRYQGIPNEQLSFNLFNEPALISAKVHRAVVEQVLEAIRKEDPNRLVICDGRMWGRTPPAELLGLKVAAATRGYDPFTITHYQASWAGKWDDCPTPTYPLKEKNILWDKERLREDRIVPWKELEAQGMGVIVGEFGAYIKTPHKVVLSWMQDMLELWREAGWGWVLWNFRGAFGFLDSQREDVAYEDWRGHKLDRAMLDTLTGGMQERA